MTSSAKISAIAMLLIALFYFASFAFASPIVGFEDGDNPATSLEFIRQHSNFYSWSGVASILVGFTLIVAVLSIADTMLQPVSSLTMRVTSILGLFAAAFFFSHGILRAGAPGTLLYMEGLNRDWGQSAYLAVQMVGTQGLATAGIFAFGAWAIGLSFIGWHSRKFPRALSLLGILPALPLLIGFLGRLALLPESVWLLYIGSIIAGIPLWCAVLGIVLLRWKPTSRPLDEVRHTR